MKTEKLLPIAFNEFYKSLHITSSNEVIDYKAYFKPYIDMAKDFAIGPYFWFIPDNITMNIVAVSDNVKSQTGYSEAEWTIAGNFDFFPSLIHPEDRAYVLAAMQQIVVIIDSYSKKMLEETKFFIYCRFVNATGKYQWKAMQLPSFLIAENGKAISAFVLISDISHLNVLNMPLMTVIANNQQMQQFYKIDPPIQLAIPAFKITKRETEIIKLMARGLNTPQLAEHLFLSYNTIENHKRNLRKKTGAKTSVEMMNIVSTNSWSN